jgi:hypothetical protein
VTHPTKSRSRTVSRSQESLCFAAYRLRLVRERTLHVGNDRKKQHCGRTIHVLGFSDNSQSHEPTIQNGSMQLDPIKSDCTCSSFLCGKWPPVVSVMKLTITSARELQWVSVHQIPRKKTCDNNRHHAVELSRI